MSDLYESIYGSWGTRDRLFLARAVATGKAASKITDDCGLP